MVIFHSRTRITGRFPQVGGFIAEKTESGRISSQHPNMGVMGQNPGTLGTLKYSILLMGGYSHLFPQI